MLKSILTIVKEERLLNNTTMTINNLALMMLNDIIVSCMY